MRPVLIAECCQNHNGSRETLKRMIHEATAAGADFVKLQTIRSRELTHRPRFDTGEVAADGTVRVIQRPYAAERERLSRLDLTLDDEAWFVDECLRAGVAPMTTCFTRAGASEVRDLGYEAVKVASYDCPSYPLLRDIKRWWKTIIVSTGACFDAEIERAAAELDGVNLTLLHCVTIYPTAFAQMHLHRMTWLRRFAPRVGLSDHGRVATDGLRASRLALALGADCIERHFTVLGETETRDGPVSITPALLKELRTFADLPRPERMTQVIASDPEWEHGLGHAQRELSATELLNRDYYRGRFASKIDGHDLYNWEDVLTEAGDGFHPKPPRSFPGAFAPHDHRS